MADAQVLEVEGPDGPRQVRLSSPDRVMWPDAGITKGDLAAYVVAVGDPLVHHIGDRPVTLQRFPDGIDGRGVLPEEPAQGRCPTGCAPSRAATRAAGGTPQIVVDEVATRRVGGADEHGDLPPVAGAHAPTTTTPTSCASTSTRSRGATFPDAVEAALALRELMAEIGLTAFAKTSGNRGVHVYARVAPTHEFLDVRHGVIGIARELERRLPDLVTTVVVEGGARRAGLRRLQPGLPRPHHRLGLQPAAAARGAGVDAGHLGPSSPR